MPRIPRIPNRSDLRKLDLKKRSAPVGRKEALHERMERELTNLKRDRRFWEGDKAYQRYVQRQFERVYNDPSGESQPLRIGPPKIFATDIEPFGVEVGKGNTNTGTRSNDRPSRKLRAARLSDPEVTASASSTLPSHNEEEEPQSFLGQPKPLSEAKHSIDQKKRHVRRLASSSDEPGWIRKYFDFEEIKGAGEGSELEQAQARLPMLLAKFREYDWDVAERLLSHYAEGSGEPVTIPSDFLVEYPPLIQAYKVVLTYFGEWLIGVREDSQRGVPTLPLTEGGKLIIGPLMEDQQVKLDELVMWERTYRGVGDNWIPGDLPHLGSEAHAAVGGATLQGFALRLELIRVGDRIEISGSLMFRVEDKYDFEQGDSFGLNALEREGHAKSFHVLSEPWQFNIAGFITIHDDQPAGALLQLVEKPFVRGVAGNASFQPAIRRPSP